MRVAVATAAWETVTVTAADVAVLPVVSRAIAVSVCDPSATVLVSQLIEYGATVSSAPICTPSASNRTPATPKSSTALANTVTAPDTDAPPPGVLLATVGGVVSAEPPVTSNASTTTMLSTDDAFLVPVASTMSVCGPDASPLAVNTGACSVSAVAYESPVATSEPSRYTLAMPANGPRKPIQLTPVALKLNVARCPAEKPSAAVPSLHARAVFPRFQPPV